MSEFSIILTFTIQMYMKRFRKICQAILLKCLYLYYTRYYDKRDAEDALDSMDRAILDGRELRVQMARYGRPSTDRRGSRRGGGGYGGGRYGGSSGSSRRRSYR